MIDACSTNWRWVAHEVHSNLDVNKFTFYFNTFAFDRNANVIKYVDQACYLAGALIIAVKGQWFVQQNCFHKTFMLNPMQYSQLKGKK